MSNLTPLICAIGDLVEDVMVALAGAIEPGTDVPCRIHRRRGGSAANVASAAVRAGARARFVGRVGADAAGDELTRALREEGVEVIVQRQGRTGTIVVLVDASGERTFLTDRGAAAALSDVDATVLEGARVLHVPAYSLDGGAIAATTRRLVAAARDQNVAISADASSTAVLRAMGPQTFTRWCADNVTIAFANEAEASLLGWLDGGVRAPFTRVVKRGPRPAILLLPDGATSEVPPAPLARVTDTTGAGDALAAGFLAAWSARPTAWREAVVAGHASAARWITTRDEEIR